MYKYKPGVQCSYEQQGYVYFTSRKYRELNRRDQGKILALCVQHGGEYHDALFEFVTSDASATALELKYHISKATLYRAVKKYYEGFPAQL